MSVFKSIRLFFRGLFRGWDQFLAKVVKGMSRWFMRGFLVAWGWCRAQNWRYLVQGLPALAATGTIVAVGIVWLSIPVQEIEARYQDRAGAASKAKDFPTALVCYERLAALGRDRPENLYEMAVALESQGQPERAREMMNQLAPVDRTGHGPAHLWLAIRHWQVMGDARERTLAEVHLNSALKAGVPDPDAAHGLLGELYAQERKHELAEIHFERAVKSRPHLRLRYAQVLEAQGKKGRASDEGKLAVNHFKTLAQADVANKAARIGWAEAVTFLKEFPQGLEILAEGQHLTPDPVYRTAAGRVYHTWYLHVVAKDPEDVASQWNLLERGLQLDSTNVALLDRLVQGLGRGGEDTAKARAVMQKLLARGEATATTHFLLGMDAWQQGAKDKAQVHWERAYELSPNMPIVANNLAWLLSHAKDGTDADRQRALKLIDLVIEKAPQALTYRDTRAHVLMKLGRWRDALGEFEFVLRRAPNFPGVHAGLAEVYAQLRMPEEAAAHRRLADAQAKKTKIAAD